MPISTIFLFNFLICFDSVIFVCFSFNYRLWKRQLCDVTHTSPNSWVKITITKKRWLRFVFRNLSRQNEIQPNWYQFIIRLKILSCLLISRVFLQNYFTQVYISSCSSKRLWSNRITQLTCSAVSTYATCILIFILENLRLENQTRVE
jgi:hypothetical protein